METRLAEEILWKIVSRSSRSKGKTDINVRKRTQMRATTFSLKIFNTVTTDSPRFVIETNAGLYLHIKTGASSKSMCLQKSHAI